MRGLVAPFAPAPERMAWRGEDLRKHDGWIDQLAMAEAEGLLEAATSLPDNPREWLAVDPARLPIGPLGRRLTKIADELENGRGFALMRGLPLGVSLLETYRIYWVLGVHLGRLVPQNSKGDLIGQVTDLGSRYQQDINARGYTSSDEMVFHSDAADVVSLLCVRQAKAGGLNGVVSMMSVYNAALETCDPELMEGLADGFRIYVRDDPETQARRAREGISPVSQRRFPVFQVFDGRLSGSVNLKSVSAVPVATGEPFTARERKTYDFLCQAVEREDLKLEFRMQPGDLLLPHNLMVLHKRSRFIDHDDPARRRLLLRFWFNLHNGRPLPDDIEQSFRKGFEAPPVVNLPADLFAGA